MDKTAIEKLCRQHQALLIAAEKDTLQVAVAGEADPTLIAALRFAGNCQVEIVAWSPERLEKALLEGDVLPSTPQESNFSASEILATILEKALQQRASDIHLQPGPHYLEVRLRVDGVLQRQQLLPAETAPALIARLKVLAGLDIAERRRPQDGQFSTLVSGRHCSFRVSTLPCLYGEKAVLRLQEQQSGPLPATALGMPPQGEAAWRNALQSPQGLILVTGPTGSGKTLTLYSGLGLINQLGVNICSVEDPVEIPLAGITQTQIAPKAGLDFQTVLRALLRQDPDVIMIGEIRDAETAAIAVKAAQTGHLVLSTLHTNSPMETLTRLSQMGVPGWMVASALRLIVAQRLVRKLCDNCKIRAPEANATVEFEQAKLPVWDATGCDHCYSGFYGRIALFEILPVSRQLQQLIASGSTVSFNETQATTSRHDTLLISGYRAIAAGQTTLEEVWRVLGVPDA